MDDRLEQPPPPETCGHCGAPVLAIYTETPFACGTHNPRVVDSGYACKPTQICEYTARLRVALANLYTYRPSKVLRLDDKTGLYTGCMPAPLFGEVTIEVEAPAAELLYG